MTRDGKRLLVTASIVGSAVVGGIILFRLFETKKTETNPPAPTPATITTVQFGEKPDTRDVTLSQGQEIHVNLPQQEGYVYDVVTHNSAIAQGIVKDAMAIIRGGSPGQAAVDVVRKAGPTTEQGMNPVYGMRFNVTVV